MAGHLLLYADDLSPRISVDPNLPRWRRVLALLVAHARISRRRFKAHVVECGVAILALVLGVLVNAAADDPKLLAYSALGFLPGWLVHLLATVVGVGGVLVLVGLLCIRSEIDKEIHLEQFGWILFAAGWGAYAFSAAWFSDGAVFSMATSTVLAVTGGLRGWFLNEIEENARQRLRASGRAA